MWAKKASLKHLTPLTVITLPSPPFGKPSELAVTNLKALSLPKKKKGDPDPPNRSPLCVLKKVTGLQTLNLELSWK